MKLAPLLYIILTFVVVDGAEILAFYPLPSRSHQRFIQPLLKELAERGHHVTLYTPYLALDEYPTTFESVIIPDYMPIMREKSKKEKKGTSSGVASEDDIWTALTFVFMRQIWTDMIEFIVQQDVVQELIKSERKYDVVFLEESFMQEPLIALGHKFNASTISTIPTANWLWTHDLHGSPYDTSYFVQCTSGLTDEMNFSERLFNTVSNMWLRLVFSLYYNPKSQELMDKYMRYPGWEQRPPMADMIADSSLVLVNSHLAINYPYPYAPHFIEVGGLNLQKAKPLPQDIQEFMDGATDGVIYFTLGSIIDVSDALGDELGKTLTQVFGKLKQRVLWKWEKQFSSLPKNIKISKWFPQQDILRHKNIKLFITHGGTLSLIEAVYNGVPMIGIPFGGDQLKNVRHMEHFGYGVKLQLSNITAKSMSWAVKEILSNPRYADNAKKRSLLFNDKSTSPLETAVYWTEYVIRHNGAHHLKTAVTTLSWYQQSMLDIYAIIAVIVTLPIYIIYKLCNNLCILFTNTKKVKKSKKE